MWNERWKAEGNAPGGADARFITVGEELSVPAALLGSVGLVTVLFLVIQIVAIAALPQLGASETPLASAARSFLGLGAQPPTASWGQRLAEGRQNYLRAPHMVWAPSLAI